MTKVFLSHSWADHGLADMLRILAIELSARGIEVIQADEFPAGSNWQASVFSAVRKADVLVALVNSRNATASVMLEIGYAIGAGRQVLLLCEHPAEVPASLSTMPAVRVGSYGDWAIDEIACRIEAATSKHQLSRPTFATAREHLQQALHDADCLEQISPSDFANLVGALFTDMGFDSTVLPPRNDSGFDIELQLGGRRIAVTVKKCAPQGRLGIGDVQRLVGACAVSRVKTALVITNTDYTASARGFVSNSPILIHLLTLEELLCESADGLEMLCC